MAPVSTRSSATPPTLSSTRIQIAAMPIMRRVSEPVTRVSCPHSTPLGRRKTITLRVLSNATHHRSRRDGSEDMTGSGGGVARLLQAVSQPADGGDDVGAQLLADARYELLDRVGIAIEILIV